MYVYVFVYVYVYVYVYLYVYVSVYVYVYVYVHVYVHVYAYGYACMMCIVYVVYDCFASAKGRILHARAPVETRKNVLFHVWP